MRSSESGAPFIEPCRTWHRRAATDFRKCLNALFGPSLAPSTTLHAISCRRALRSDRVADYVPEYAEAIRVELEWAHRIGVINSSMCWCWWSLFLFYFNRLAAMGLRDQHARAAFGRAFAPPICETFPKGIVRR